jgi:hypothetical protein
MRPKLKIIRKFRRKHRVLKIIKIKLLNPPLLVFKLVTKICVYCEICVQKVNKHNGLHY